MDSKIPRPLTVKQYDQYKLAIWPCSGDIPECCFWSWIKTREMIEDLWLAMEYHRLKARRLLKQIKT